MYRKLIVQVTGCYPAEAARVERFMRDRWGTLDSLSRAEFRREAIEALHVARENPDLYTNEP